LQISHSILKEIESLPYIFLGRGPPARSDHRILVSGLPTSGSWQDIKDHMRDAGEVVYADVFRDGSGICEFAKRRDMEWALDNLDDTSFKSHEVFILLVPL